MLIPSILLTSLPSQLPLSLQLQVEPSIVVFIAAAVKHSTAVAIAVNPLHTVDFFALPVAFEPSIAAVPAIAVSVAVSVAVIVEPSIAITIATSFSLLK
jgi:hypothetical protein